MTQQLVPFVALLQDVISLSRRVKNALRLHLFPTVSCLHYAQAPINAPINETWHDGHIWWFSFCPMISVTADAVNT